MANIGTVNAHALGALRPRVGQIFTGGACLPAVLATPLGEWAPRPICAVNPQRFGLLVDVPETAPDNTEVTMAPVCLQ